MYICIIIIIIIIIIMLCVADRTCGTGQGVRRLDIVTQLLHLLLLLTNLILYKTTFICMSMEHRRG